MNTQKAIVITLVVTLLIAAGCSMHHNTPNSRPVSEVDPYAEARAILGWDFISPQEAAEAWGFTYTDAQLRQFTETLPDVKVLQWLWEHNYMLIPGPVEPTSLLDICSMRPDSFYVLRNWKNEIWYEGEQFAHTSKVAMKWLALGKDAVPDSFGRTWNQQTALLSSEEYVPTAGEAVWGATTYYEVRGVYLLPDFHVRTSSVDARGGQVFLGYFDADGLDVNSCRGDRRDGDVGLASARKL